MIVQLPYLEQRNFIKKIYKTMCIKKVNHLLVNTHLETRKELNVSL